MKNTFEILYDAQMENEDPPEYKKKLRVYRYESFCDWCGRQNVLCPVCGIMTCRKICPKCKIDLEQILQEQEEKEDSNV